MQSECVAAKAVVAVQAMMQTFDPAPFRSRPVPAFGAEAERKEGYRVNTPIDRQAAAAGEDCVDLRDIGVAGDNHYYCDCNPPYYFSVPGAVPNLWVRRSVADRLVRANGWLKSLGLELYVFDAWRPQAIQRHFHDVWFPDWLRRHRPELSDAERLEEVERYWAAPSQGENSPSPHSTGGAVDLTLRFIGTRQPLYMAGMFDDLTENAHTDWLERREPHSMSDQEARSNRRLLYWTMREAGFANNPTEWWHYSHGDQMWARMTGEGAAIYGSCRPGNAD